MSGFAERVRTCALVIASGMLGWLAVVAAQTAPPPEVWQLTVIRNVVEAAFPELVGSNSPVKVTLNSSFNDSWLLSPFIAIDTRSNTSTEYGFVGSFFFTRDHLDHAQFSGPRVGSARQEAFAEQIKRHPEWTETELAVALADAGAKYGPDRKRAFTDALPLGRFFPVFGKPRTVSVSFRWRLGSADLGADDIISPRWIVQVDGNNRHGGSVCYTLLCEPFNGELIAISWRQCG